MVIALSSQSPLLFDRGSMITGPYVDDVLQTTLLSYLDGHIRVLFQQDVSPHIAHRTMDFL